MEVVNGFVWVTFDMDHNLLLCVGVSFPIAPAISAFFQSYFVLHCAVYLLALLCVIVLLTRPAHHSVLSNGVCRLIANSHHFCVLIMLCCAKLRFTLLDESSPVAKLPTAVRMHDIC